MKIFYTAMENTMAHLILYLNMTSAYDECEISKIFSQGRLCVDIDKSLQRPGKRMVFTSSPFYSVDQTADHGSLTGCMVCDAYVYELKCEDKDDKKISSCGLKMTRMKVKFKDVKGVAEIEEFHWKVIQVMEPWQYGSDMDIYGDGKRGWSPLSENPCGNSGSIGPVSSRDYGEIRKLVVRPWDQLWLKEDVPQKQQIYGPGGLPENLKKPLIGLTTFPSVDLEDAGSRARARFLIQIFGVGSDKSKESVVARCFYLAEYRLEKEEQRWTITDMCMNPLLRLPDTPYRQGQRYDKLSADILPWTLCNSEQPGVYTEDSYAVENIVNAWVYACRRGKLCGFFNTYMKHEAFTPTMFIRSQGAKTRKLVGEEEILNKLSGMDAMYHPGMLTFHTATTPLIEISADGTRAMGTWFDHSATNLSGQDDSALKIPYMVFVARYRHEFRKIDGKWYLTDFFWEPLISLDDWIWDREKDNTKQNRTKGPEIIKDHNSPTGYYVKFSYDNPDVQSVGIIGDWMFSDVHHSSRWKSAAIWPHQWHPGVFPHALLGLKKTPEALTTGESQTGIDPSKFEFDWDILKRGLYEMEKCGDDGHFQLILPLPSGIFNYRFVLDMPEGNPLKMVTVPDPENLPVTVGEKDQNFSQVYVPFDKERQITDRSIELPLESGKGGTITSFTYLTAPEFDDGKAQYGAVYLPEGYDPQRSRPYPVLYLSHGGSGNAGDWPAQGGLKNIMDHLIQEGRTEPMAVVVMDNEEFHWDNLGKCIPNLTRYLIPWAESHFNIGGDMKQRAFAGFSAGGFLAYEVLASVPEMFHYIGVWSGGKRVDLLTDPKANPCMQVHIGAGRYDDAFYSFGYKLEDLLGELGVEFTSFFPEGGHQWSVWRQLLEDFAGRVLWKE